MRLTPNATSPFLLHYPEEKSDSTTESIHVQLQCTVLAAAVIGAFSWTTIADAYWLTHGFWHMSLILSILGILLSASEVTVLDLLGPLTLPPTPSHAPALSNIDVVVDRYRPLLLSPTTSGSVAQHYVPRRKMVFTWQAPVMFMSYSVCAFLGGLTILVCTPFIRHEREWGSGHNVRMSLQCDTALRRDVAQRAC